MAAQITGCELCGGIAAVHCAADSAFLCDSCDAKVHSANFLASRHIRRRLGADEEENDDGCCWSTESASCVSDADSATSVPPAAARSRAAAVGRTKMMGRKRRARAEVVLEGWAKRMGFAPAAARRRAASAATALRAVAAARVPLRVAMAAALWSEIAASGCGGAAADAALLRRLEASAHVPARLVLTVASWMARAATARRAPADAQEGWAECS